MVILVTDIMEKEKINPMQKLKIGNDDFVKRVDEIAAQKFVEKRQALVFESLFSEKENIKKFKKRLRGNSKKYYKRILKRSNKNCEICGWGIGVGSCLQIHHVRPVSKYYGALMPFNSVPDERFELSNLIALCPNCHTLVHQYQTYTKKPQEVKVLKGIFKAIGIEDVFFKFLSVASEIEFSDKFKKSTKSIFDEVEND